MVLRRVLLSVLAVLLGCAGPLPLWGGELRLAGVFGDHMVLQRERPVPVWGWAAPGETVTVSFAGQSVQASAGAEGLWVATLAPLALSAAPQDLTVSARTTLKLSDVLVGDVWLLSGQSNMAFGLNGAATADELKRAELPNVRFRGYFECFAGDPRADIEPGAWKRISPGSAGACSAVGFYFARKVQAETGVPIGLLTCTVGGTEIECWMPPEAFSAYPANAAAGRRLDEAVRKWRAELPASLEALEAWVAQSRRALADGAPALPPAPRLPLHPNEDRARWVRTQSLFNGMVHPLTRCALKGVLWYQGENNSGEEDAYFEKKRALIETWRKRFGAELPFYYVQLTSYTKPDDDPAGSKPGWNRTRMGQLKALALPRTGMAVTIDAGDADDIHPRNKADVGERLALWALAKDYGKTGLVCSGPLYAGMAVEGPRIRIRFAPDSVGGGLIAARKTGRAPAEPQPGEPLRRFAIAGADRKWVWATARIDGATVLVEAPGVPSPVAVRYAFSNNPEGANLYNKEGLPASPFRTDDW